MELVYEFIRQIQYVTADTVVALTVLILIDVITGILSAFYNNEFDPDKTMWGVAKKAVVFTVVLSASVFDTVLIQKGALFTTAVSSFYIIMEFMSIVRNLDSMGVPVPDELKQRLQYELDKIDIPEN